MTRGKRRGINRGFWRDDTSRYYSAIHTEAFLTAIEQAKKDGTLGNWTWAMLLGKVPPPGYEWTGQKCA